LGENEGKERVKDLAQGSLGYKKRRGALFSLGVLALGVMAAEMGGCAGPGDGRKDFDVPEFVLTYAENQPEDYPTTQGAYRFAQLVYERTNGRVEIQVSAGGVLGEEQSTIEQMQFGGIDFARVSLSSLSDFIPKMNVLQMPYLYTDADHMWQVLEGEIGDVFLDSLDGVGLVALSWYDAGARNFYSVKNPVETLEDMKGMRVRVQESELMKAVVEALGASAVPMAYDEVYSALETGRIDAAENNWPSYESMRHFEVAPYYTVDEHTRVPEMQLVSEATWKKLPQEYHEIIRQCARESAVYERQLWQERIHQSEERVRKEGCQVVELSQEEKGRFREAMLSIYGEYCGEYMDIIEEILEAGR
jgi:tripartite ATP-independent transporter DctP family solute receptor